MLHFINTFYLFFIAAGLIPLLLHLLNRKKTKKIPFSTLRFLKVMEKQRLKNIKLLQWLLLIIRTLLIIFLVLAFARPTITGNFSIPLTDDGKTAVLILDDGLNMQTYDPDGMHFQRAKRMLAKFIQMYQDNDDVHVIKAVEGDELNASAISDLSCRYQLPDWSATLNHCSKIMDNTTKINKEIVIISNYIFKYPLQDSLTKHFADLPLYLCAIGKQTIYNHSIDTLKIKNQMLEVDKPISFEVVIANRSLQRDDEIEVHLYIDEKRVAYQQIYLQPGISKTVEMSYTPKNQKIYQGYVELSDDDLLADNKYFFSFQIQPEIQVLLLNNSSTNFLETALTTIAEESNITITNERISAWKRHHFDSYHVIFISNPGPLENGLIKKLNTFSNQHGCIIFEPGDQTNPDQFNRDFKTIFPHLQIEQRVETSSTNQYFTLKSLQLEHPFFTGMYRKPDKSLTLPKFYKYFRARIMGPVEPLITFTNDDPFLLKDDGNYLMLSYIDNLWTDLPYKGMFTPLMARLLQTAADKASPIPIQTLSDSPVNITLQANQEHKRYALHFPDGNVQNLIPVTRNARIVLPVGKVFEPGNYPVYSDQELITVFMQM
jgi:hypothetical protein